MPAKRSNDTRTGRSTFWRWLHLASPGGQLASHPVAGLLCVISLVCALVGFVRWASGFSNWQVFVGITAILWANALIGAAIQAYYERREPARGDDLGDLRWRERLAAEELPASVQEVIEPAADDVSETVRASRPASWPAAAPAIDWAHYAWTVLIVAACGLVGWLLWSWKVADANIVMVFLVGIAFVAARFGRGPAIVASLLGVLVFDFCFVPPYFTFAVADAQYVITFAVMLAIGLVISELTARLQDRLRASQEFERRASMLHALSQQLSGLTQSDAAIQAAAQRLEELFSAEVVLYLRESDGALSIRAGEGTSIARESANADAAKWAAEKGLPAGAGTNAVPTATAFLAPLIGAQGTLGVI